jgi:hypothetical protein
MRNLLLAAGVAGLIGLFTACGGGDDHAGVLPDNPTAGGKKSSAGGRNSGGKSSPATDAGGAGGSDATDQLGPTVAILAPAAVDDPNEDGVLTGDSVTVTCKATQSEAADSTPVNVAKVTLSIVGADGKVIETKAAARGQNDDEFFSEFSLTALPSGAVRFKCTAESQDAHSASEEVGTLLDHGPIITFIRPEADAPQALNQPLDLEFTVEAAPLTGGDDNAAVDSVSLDIIGNDIDLTDAMDKPGHYRLQIDFADPKQFMPAPTGSTALSVSATNKRTPTGVEATGTRAVVVDGAGPTIKITSPLDKDVVGGKKTLSFDIVDPISGVDPHTVVVALNNIDHPYKAGDDAWTLVKNTFTYTFDSRNVKDAVLQITVNVRADDLVGNHAVPASELLYLDNYPPYVDLDPLPIRTVNEKAECSRSFDPVGDATTNDLDTATTSGFFRAVVWDETNRDPDGKIIPHFSMTNQASVHLYLQGDPSKPLLIDTDNDDICDDVAQVDSTDSLDFTPIGKSGQAWYAIDDAVAPTTASLGCVTKFVNKPDQLCADKVSDMWQVIQDEFNNIPVIYGASPTAGHECTGVGWEFTTKLDADGWVCFATRAVDNAGNVGISTPLRICVDLPGGASPPCAVSSTTPPSCTDGCTPPPHWGGKAVAWK